MPCLTLIMTLMMIGTKGFSSGNLSTNKRKKATEEERKIERREDREREKEGKEKQGQESREERRKEGRVRRYVIPC